MKNRFILELPEEELPADQAESAASQNETGSVEAAAGTEETNGSNAVSEDMEALPEVFTEETPALSPSEVSVPGMKDSDSAAGTVDSGNEQVVSEELSAGGPFTEESTSGEPDAEDFSPQLPDSSAITEPNSESESLEDAWDFTEDAFTDPETEPYPSSLESLILEGFQVTHELMTVQIGLLLVLLAMFIFRFVHHLISDMVTSKFQ